MIAALSVAASLYASPIDISTADEVLNLTSNAVPRAIPDKISVNLYQHDPIDPRQLLPFCNDKYLKATQSWGNGECHIFQDYNELSVQQLPEKECHFLVYIASTVCQPFLDFDTVDVRIPQGSGYICIPFAKDVIIGRIQNSAKWVC
jgi:hypothetical protein